jgi:hypothetical protein
LLNKKPPEQKPVQKEEKDICSQCQRDPCECDDSHGFVYEESDDKGEYDYEGDMAMSDLRSIIHNAQQLHDMMEDDTNLPEWLQAKITKAEDYISSAANYMRSEMNEDIVAEEYELAGVGVAYELGRRAHKERKTARDNPYSATREARKNDEWAKGLERGKHDANAARHFRSSVREQGMTEADGQLDEKSVSQAQFRTMAAAAHNPKFAKKVGIKQSVAKEFNQADKGSNYKKLPDRTNEGGDVFMANIKDTPEYKAGFATGKLPVPHPEGTQQYASYYKGVIDKASPTLNKVGEGEQQKGADYRDPPEADYGDDYQDMVARVKKLAGLGPLKTVYDPNKRVYRNIPTAVQPKK